MVEQMVGVFTGSPAERTRMPIRRQSRAAGRCESVFWRRTDRQEVRKILLAARCYERAERRSGERCGPLGSVAIELMELLVNLIDFKTGRLEPSIDTLMRHLKRSRDAVVRALKNLRTHGFLDWLRRYVPTGNEGRGPQVQQTSNAYRLLLPHRALQLLGRLGKSPPMPDDQAQALKVRAAEMQAHRETLSLEELARFELGDTPLGRAFALLGKQLKKRESAEQTESHTHLYIKRTT